MKSLKTLLSILVAVLLTQSVSGQVRFLNRYFNQEYSPYFFGPDVINVNNQELIYLYNKPFFLTQFRDMFYHNILDSIHIHRESFFRRYLIKNDSIDNLPTGILAKFPNDSCNMDLYFDSNMQLDSMYWGNKVSSSFCNRNISVSYSRNSLRDSISIVYMPSFFEGSIIVNKNSKGEWTDMFSRSSSTYAVYDRTARRVIDTLTGNESIYLFDYDYDTEDSTIRFIRHYTHDKSIGKNTMLRYKFFNTNGNIDHGKYEFYYDLSGRLDSGFFAHVDSNYNRLAPPYDILYHYYNYHYHNDDVIPDSIVEYHQYYERYAKVFFYKRKNKYYSVNEMDMLAHSVKVFPNPAQGQVTVECESVDISGNKFYLIDLSGRQYALKPTEESDHKLTFNVSGYSPGLYFIISQGSAGETLFQQKVVIQN